MKMFMNRGDILPRCLTSNSMTMKLEHLVDFFTACGNTLNPNNTGSVPVLNHALLANFFASAVVTINQNSALQQRVDGLQSQAISRVDHHRMIDL